MNTCTKQVTGFKGRRKCVSSALERFAKNTRRLRGILPKKSKASIVRIAKVASKVRKAKNTADAKDFLSQAQQIFAATVELAKAQDPKGKKELEVNLEEIDSVFETAIAAMDTAT